MNIIQSTNMVTDQQAGKFMLLAHPFRIFFLATGIYAMLAVFGWLAFLFGEPDQYFRPAFPEKFEGLVVGWI